MKSHFQLLIFIFCCTHSLNLYANLRQISSRDGLSNSSVICLIQDNSRFLWIGTYDGLNMYDGREIHIYKPDINNQNSLSSNVIRNIVETEKKYLWISTKWGLNKLSLRNNTIKEYYNEFKEDSPVAKDKHDNLYVIGKKGTLSFYNKLKNKFIDLPIDKNIVYEDIISFIIDSSNNIWITQKGIIEIYTVSLKNPNMPQIIRHKNFKHLHRINYTYYSKGKILFIDENDDLYMIDQAKNIFIKNLSPIIHENGLISSVIFDNNDILIGFKTNGLIRLQARNNYKSERIDINCGVFSLWKDETQDIVWIGTDGQGVYALTKDEYTFTSLNLIQLPVKKERPIRTIHTDPQNNLWLGTKDNGIIRIKNYNTARDYSPTNVIHYTTNDGLSNNAVFAFTLSNQNKVLWIGSDGPNLNYYSYQDSKIHSLINHTAIKITNVHSLFEAFNTLLWVGSGNTLLRISINKKNNTLETKNIKRFGFKIKNEQTYNQIYSLYPENDSIIWIGMRGNGIIRFNAKNGKYKLITFDKYGIAPMNDILCIYQDKKKNLWLGTSYGLTKLNMRSNGTFYYKNFNENEGLPNNTIHGIVEDSKGKLWLSSNAGIILFNPLNNTFRSFNDKTGLKVIEFSDNAYFKDKLSSTCFFGGVDGIIRIESKNKKSKNFTPTIFFKRLRIFNKDYNINDFQKKEGDEQYIELKYNQNFFAISFVAMDFINGESSKYSYKLENFNDVWMDTRLNEAQFTNIAPGSYLLKVKYNDGIRDNESQICSIRIIILPPWYMTIYAKALYLLLMMGAAIMTYLYITKKYEKRRIAITKQLNEKYKEEVYEGKLRFFTNITHEFCTPLTLIYGPCERILNHDNSDSFIKKYAQIIKSNAERLNSLIQEVIDFRRMETGNKVCEIQSLNISDLVNEITESFSELAEQNNIHFQTNIPQNIIWNSDNSCFTKILNNIISNAFKYTPEKGRIVVSVNVENDKLVLKVYNTGKGISQENIPLIFNRYSVLDNIKENAIKGLSSRNGLGLAICHSMTKLLNGAIEVESEINQYAQFIITLPHLEIKDLSLNRACGEEHKGDIDQANKAISTDLNMPSTITYKNSADKNQQVSILIIDDNKELLWMLKDILSDEYTVLTAEDGEIGLEIIKQNNPDLIVTDIMMPNIDGITLIKQIKQNKHTMQIPLVILSAKNTNDEKIEGIESGADAYIPKPFNTQYLKAVIKHLIDNKKNMEMYYNSSASAFEFTNGQLQQKEDINFLFEITKIIEKNMDNPDFNPEELAKSVQISISNLYRKFKDLNQLTPKDFIKEQRISYAAKLLLTTTLTIQEIMYKAGFTNRSHFYKEFFKRYNQTPKEYRKTNKLKDNSLI